MFQLDPRLAADTVVIGDGPLCRYLLMNDRRWPWVILVPRRAGLIDWHDLDSDDRDTLAAEAARASAVLRRIDGVQKTNVATLGNLVAQFHLHVVARHPGDAAWPGPVWGAGRALRYDAGAQEALCRRLRHALAGGPPA